MAYVRLSRNIAYATLCLCRVSDGAVFPLVHVRTLFQRISCGEGQTEGATWSATLQQGLIQR